MALPQPSSRYPSATTLSVVVLAILMTALPAQLLAATEQLSCSPTRLGYGRVAVGRIETLLVAVTNSGQGSVTISSVTANHSQFKVSKLKLPQVLAAGASLEVSVTFAPSATGWVDGQLTFASTASNPTLNLGVGGLGVT